MIAVSYLRVSGLSQVDGDGFPRQREAIASYANTHGINVIQEFAEEGISGTTETPDRPALSELLTYATEQGIRLVLVEKADRLARDLIAGELILRELQRAGIQVLDSSGNDLSNNSDPTKKLIRQVLSAVAEYEKSALVAKLRAAKARLRRQGKRMEGPPPLGATDAEKAAVARILELHAEGMSLRKIAAQLDQEQVPTRKGGPWQYPVIAKLIKKHSLVTT
jgi:DNA invertase Pin-like site-specific DNA recombinase